MGTFQDHTIAFIDETHKKEQYKRFITRLESFAAKLEPGSFGAAGVSHKDQEKLDVLFPYFLFIVLERPSKRQSGLLARKMASPA